ncbi:MAG: hypothetical protein GX456_16225 [Verrucomicrobia bacterium]|nr:hypothetical protein [Verrucomicrobiota bacterium]
MKTMTMKLQDWRKRVVSMLRNEHRDWNLVRTRHGCRGVSARLPLALLVAAVVCGNVVAQSFSDIEGKWTLKKKDPRYGEVTQTVEFKNNSFTFRVVDKENSTVLYAKGKASVEKLGPFKVIKLTEIEGGQSENDLWPTSDDRTIVYSAGWNALTVAVNFDRERSDEEVESQKYTKVRQ